MSALTGSGLIVYQLKNQNTNDQILDDSRIFQKPRSRNESCNETPHLVFSEVPNANLPTTRSLVRLKIVDDTKSNRYYSITDSVPAWTSRSVLRPS